MEQPGGEEIVTHVLFVATPMSTISVYYSYLTMCPACHLLLVCTTLVCVLFVATPTSTISVYYFSMCPVCDHSHIYYYCILL